MLKQGSALRQMFNVEFPPDGERSFGILDETLDERSQKLPFKRPRRVDATQVRRKEEMQVGSRRRGSVADVTTAPAATAAIGDQFQLWQNRFGKLFHFQRRDASRFGLVEKVQKGEVTRQACDTD